MNQKPIKKIINPYWVGRAVYGTREADFALVRLSKVVSLGARYIETLNTLYTFRFTSTEAMNRFYNSVDPSMYSKGRTGNE